MTAKEIFEKNPQVEKVFATTDGNLFLNEFDAKFHGRTLGEKKNGVTTHHRPEMAEEVVPDKKAKAETPEQTAKAVKAAADKKTKAETPGTTAKAVKVDSAPEEDQSKAGQAVVEGTQGEAAEG
ncbi:MAG: hypothetical protein C4K58_06910 [Flavobacteriaceae bacterium]|nr:MAG: hypothetical protein C4K58_06910 [Flavobacteriaceae bacterium]